MHEPGLKGKSHGIPKRLVWDAWLKVKDKGGAAGVDGVTIEQFAQDLKGERLAVRLRAAVALLRGARGASDPLTAGPAGRPQGRGKIERAFDTKRTQRLVFRASAQQIGPVFKSARLSRKVSVVASVVEAYAESGDHL